MSHVAPPNPGSFRHESTLVNHVETPALLRLRHHCDRSLDPQWLAHAQTPQLSPQTPMPIANLLKHGFRKVSLGPCGGWTRKTNGVPSTRLPLGTHMARGCRRLVESKRRRTAAFIPRYCHHACVLWLIRLSQPAQRSAFGHCQLP